jgi:hypothetical protein
VQGNAGENCVEGNTGPLCALCMPGYALQSGACAPCDPADAWSAWSPGSQAGLLVGCVVAALIIIAIAFFQPLVPPLERAADAIVARGSAGLRSAKERLTPRCGRTTDAAPLAAVAEAKGGAATGDGAAAGEPREEALLSQVAASVTATADREAPAQHGDAAETVPAHGHHHHSVREAHQHALVTAALHQAAFAGGAMAAMVMSENGDDGGGGGDGAVAAADEFVNWLEEAVERLQKIGKIVVKCVPARLHTRSLACLRAVRQL